MKILSVAVGNQTHYVKYSLLIFEYNCKCYSYVVLIFINTHYFFSKKSVFETEIKIENCQRESSFFLFLCKIKGISSAC